MSLSRFLSGILVCALGLVAASGCGSDPPSRPTAQSDSLLQGTYWRQQARTTILPAWTDHGRTDEGLFYAELDRSWSPTDTTTQYPGMLARHLFSYAAAYLMDGDEAHLERAEPVLDFLIEHGWDEEYGGWYNAVTRTGDVVDAEKDLFMQIYATTGLALYYVATRDSTAKTYLDRSRAFMQTHAWDDENGGYVDVLNRDGSVKTAVKDFSPQLAPLSGYLLYLYPAPKDEVYLREAERIIELALTHMQGEQGWIRERFARDWTFLPNDAKNSHLNVGHNAEVAWLLLRLYALTGTESYRRKGLALTDKLLEHAFHSDTGAWIHKLKRSNPAKHPDEAVWWVQAYGNMLQLYAYRITGKQRYLTAFRKGAQFWNEAFVDETYGGTVLRTTLDGTVTGGQKAVRTKTSYHAMEHALLTSLYLDLWTNHRPTTLHYRLSAGGDLRLHTLPLEDTPAIQQVLLNGKPQPTPDSIGHPVRISADTPRPARLTIDLTSTSSTP